MSCAMGQGHWVSTYQGPSTPCAKNVTKQGVAVAKGLFTLYKLLAAVAIQRCINVGD